MFHVDSEVGRLRQVVLHRPDLELKRLTPDNAADLLFDDVLWVSRAQAEHDAFAGALRSRGVVVHYYSDLLAQTLEIPEAREYILDRVFDPRWHGPLAASTLRAAMDGLGPGRAWRSSWPAGSPSARSPNWARSRRASPSTRSTPTVSCSPRCRTCSTSGTPRAGSTAACPSTRCACRPGSGKPSPTRPSTAGTRCSPAAGFEVWYHGADAAPATIEGGDVLVIGNGAVLVGMSERTTPQAVEVLAHRLFAAGAARCLVADRHAEDARVHAPGHAADDGRLRGVHQVRRDGHAAVLHGRAGRERPRAQGHRSPAGGHAHAPSPPRSTCPPSPC